MAASSNDKFLKVGDSTVTTLAVPGKALGATSITVGSTANFPTDTGIVFAIRQVDSDGEYIPGTGTEWVGTVTSATTLSMLATPVDGADQVYPAGSTTQVYIPLTSYGHNRLVDGILEHANQDGTMKSGLTYDDPTFTGTVTHPNNSIPNSALAGGITPEKLQSGTGTSWVWQSWTPTWTNLTVGNGTVLARFSQVGKTVSGTIGFKMGNTSSISGAIQFSLPVTASSSYTTLPAPMIGILYLENLGVIGFQGFVQQNSTTKGQCVVIGTAGTYSENVAVSTSVPFAWGVDDYFVGTFTYEAA